MTLEHEKLGPIGFDETFGCFETKISIPTAEGEDAIIFVTVNGEEDSIEPETDSFIDAFWSIRESIHQVCLKSLARHLKSESAVQGFTIRGVEFLLPLEDFHYVVQLTKGNSNYWLRFLDKNVVSIFVVDEDATPIEQWSISDSR